MKRIYVLHKKGAYSSSLGTYRPDSLWGYFRTKTEAGKYLKKHYNLNINDGWYYGRYSAILTLSEPVKVAP